MPSDFAVCSFHASDQMLDPMTTPSVLIAVQCSGGAGDATCLLDFGKRFVQCVVIDIKNDDVRAEGGHFQSGGFSDAGCATGDDGNLARKLFLRRHALELRFFKIPIFDIE